MQPLRFGAHSAGRLDGDHFQAAKQPSRNASSPRADVQRQRRCVRKQVNQPAVNGFGCYGFVAARHIENVLVSP
jgi:hypothetical protein